MIAPAIVTLVAVGLIALHLPINGPIVITGAILLFLPGAALVACKRDLIDGENVSGTARLAEALLLGTAVALGVSLALGLGSLIGVPVALHDLAPTAWRGLIQVIAAVLAVGFFAIRAGAPGESVGVSALLGGVGVATRELVARAQADAILATAIAATVIGTLARLAARRFRSLSTIWVGAASLPLLPGLLILRGLTAPTPLDGSRCWPRHWRPGLRLVLAWQSEASWFRRSCASTAAWFGPRSASGGGMNVTQSGDRSPESGDAPWTLRG